MILPCMLLESLEVEANLSHCSKITTLYHYANNLSS